MSAVEILTLIEGLLFLGMIFGWAIMTLAVVPNMNAGLMERRWAQRLSFSMGVIVAASALTILTGAISFNEGDEATATIFVIATFLHGLLLWVSLGRAGLEYRRRRNNGIRHRNSADQKVESVEE